MELPLEDRIRQRAYFLWIDSAGAGNDVYYWLEAESQILAEIALEAEAARALADATARLNPGRRVNALVLLESDSDCDQAA